MRHAIILTVVLLLVAGCACQARREEQVSCSLRGRIVMKGQPVEGATVRLKREGASRSDGYLAACKTDAGGSFRFDDITPGGRVVVVISKVLTSMWYIKTQRIIDLAKAGDVDMGDIVVGAMAPPTFRP